MRARVRASERAKAKEGEGRKQGVTRIHGRTNAKTFAYVYSFIHSFGLIGLYGVALMLCARKRESEFLYQLVKKFLLKLSDSNKQMWQSSFFSNSFISITNACVLFKQKKFKLKQ